MDDEPTTAGHPCGHVCDLTADAVCQGLLDDLATLITPADTQRLLAEILTAAGYDLPGPPAA